MRQTKFLTVFYPFSYSFIKISIHINPRVIKIRMSYKSVVYRQLENFKTLKPRKLKDFEFKIFVK